MGARIGIAVATALVAAIAATPASGEPGQIYIADQAGFTVYGFDPVDGTFSSIEGGSFGELRDVTVAPDGALFIADAGGSQPGAMDNVFRKMLPGGPLQTFVSGPPLINTSAVRSTTPAV